jgi:membrane protease YdiL (CAAX protease family)
MFRGFLYRGWARSPRAVLPAVVITSTLWAAGHVQYDWFVIPQIFLSGLLLGWVRWRSGSTMLTFAMHASAHSRDDREGRLAHLIGGSLAASASTVCMSASADCGHVIIICGLGAQEPDHRHRRPEHSPLP